MGLQTKPGSLNKKNLRQKPQFISTTTPGGNQTGQPLKNEPVISIPSIRQVDPARQLLLCDEKRPARNPPSRSRERKRFAGTGSLARPRAVGGSSQTALPEDYRGGVDIMRNIERIIIWRFFLCVEGARSWRVKDVPFGRVDVCVFGSVNVPCHDSREGV